ncbi:hypothetical protein NFI96_006920 [Prochilodus magdalenae]|nr:hypothetical protein NFI96_006920 [Prochilodus magdalenae]
MKKNRVIQYTERQMDYMSGPVSYMFRTLLQHLPDLIQVGGSDVISSVSHYQSTDETECVVCCVCVYGVTGVFVCGCTRDARAKMRANSEEDAYFIPESILGNDPKVVQDEHVSGEFGLVINGHSLWSGPPQDHHRAVLHQWAQDAAHRTLPTGRCPQDAAHRTLPIGRCPQDAAHRMLPTGPCPQDSAHRTLPTGPCPQDTAHRTLPTGRCPQDAAHRTLPT